MRPRQTESIARRSFLNGLNNQLHCFKASVVASISICKQQMTFSARHLSLWQLSRLTKRTLQHGKYY